MFIVLPDEEVMRNKLREIIKLPDEHFFSYFLEKEGEQITTEEFALLFLTAVQKYSKQIGTDEYESIIFEHMEDIVEALIKDPKAQEEALDIIDEISDSL